MKRAFFLTAVFLVVLFTACSSVDSDAKKAAELNKESMQYIKEGDLQQAEKIYKQSQEIVSLYKGTDKAEEFQTAYSNYMHGEVLNN